MKKTILTILGIIAIAALAAWGVLSYHAPASNSGHEAPYIVPPLTQRYENSEYNFSLKMPAEFVANEFANDQGGKTIVLQIPTGTASSSEPVGIQIVVSPSDSDTHELTQKDITEAIPDLKISDVQTLEVGESYKGVAFKSDNPAFNGASREVWFVFKGNLYQISTYARLDDLLKQIFSTWQFEQ